MMGLEPTIGTAVAMVIGAMGVAVFINGIRYALVDDVGVGAVLLFVAWWITTLGALL